MNKKVLIILIIAALLVLLCLCTPVITYLFFLAPHQVAGISMEPTFQDGEYILNSKIAKPERGDVVVYKSETYDKIGRIVGIGGDKIEIKEGLVYINGSPESYTGYTPKTTYGAGEIWENKEYTVPENEFFILGDNRSNSKDSRYSGFVKRSDIKDVYLLTYKK
jgi:signal peptidase I